MKIEAKLLLLLRKNTMYNIKRDKITTSIL